MDSDSDREPDELDLIKFERQIMMTLESGLIYLLPFYRL